MENPINNEINLIHGKRGRPRKDEQSEKLWEDKDHIAKYNKIYYANRKQNTPKIIVIKETIECPECFKCVNKSYFETHKTRSFHRDFVANLKRLEDKKNI